MTPRSVAPLREVQAILTADCNLRCSYCYQNAKHAQAMPWPVLRAALDVLLASRARTLSVSFTGGEALLEFPLLRRAIARVGRRRSPGQRVTCHLATNGTLLDAATLAYLDAHDVRLTISCDGLAAAQDVRQPGSFEVLDALFDALRARHDRLLRDRLTVSITLVRAAVPHLADSFDYLLRKGVRDVVLTAASGRRDWSPDATREFDAQLGRIYDSSLGHYRAAGVVPLRAFRRSAPGRITRRRPVWGCSAPVGDALAVDVDGQVYPCPSMARSYQAFADPGLDARTRRLSLGDVRGADLPARLAVLQEACRCSGLFAPQHVQHSGTRQCAGCRYRRDCFVCPIARVQGPSADVGDVPDYLCAFNRVVAKYRRRFVVERQPGEALRSIINGRRKAEEEHTPWP